MFRRRKQEDGETGELDELDELDDVEQSSEQSEEDAEVAAELAASEADQLARQVVRPEGPWDVEDAPEDELPRLDLGALRVPLVEEGELRVELTPEGVPFAATLAVGESSLQIMVFAAPRTEGIWLDVREEIGGTLSQGGGSASERDGPLGHELIGVVPTQQEDGSTAMVPARFVGVDGPRWFLRGLFHGPAARDASAAVVLDRAFRQIVVVRGPDPMAVRDPLPLKLPEAAQQAQELAREQAGDPLQLAERGPEITEVR